MAKGSGKTVAIIGAGVVGRALGKVLRSRRYTIKAIASRTPASAREAAEFIGAGRVARTASAAAKSASLVFITTPDRAVRQVCDEIAEEKAFRKSACVFHLSGGLTSEALGGARACGAYVASLHPMQSFASPEEAVKRFRGTVFAFQGDPGAREAAARVVKSLGGAMAMVDAEAKSLYHAAGVVMSNYLVSIADLGVILLELAGLTPEQARQAALPLIQGTVQNIERLGVPAALTGPIARGDAETIEAHLRALAKLPRDIRRLYRELGRYTVRVAQRKGTLDGAGARHVLHLLDRYRPRDEDRSSS